MSKALPKSSKQTITAVFMYLSLIVAILLFGIGGLAVWANQFSLGMVKDELSAQKITFPEKGSPALDPAIYPDLQQYAGQLVDTPAEAKAYANGYIGRHLAKVADGKVYSEVSTLAMKDPTNQTLQQQKASLFQGETLRGLLLTSGYGFGTFGIIAGYAAYACFIAAAALLAVAGGLFVRSRR